jgi:hypothetical protein
MYLFKKITCLFGIKTANLNFEDEKIFIAKIWVGGMAMDER